MKTQVQVSVAEIRERLETMLSTQDLDTQWLDQLSADPRSGVRKLALTFRKRLEKIAKEQNRIYGMLEFDRSYRSPDLRLLAGIDEAGRGCLAGPVVAAAVILPETVYFDGLNDSKQMSATLREKVYKEIVQSAITYGVGVVSAAEIDTYNILQATFEAMRRALSQLSVEPDILLNDAVRIPAVTIPQVPIIQGDCKSFSIAAASVLAKVTRDRLMREYALQYPEYGFERHVGYGTSEHLEALEQFGPSPIHRLTFAKVTDVKGR